MKAPGTIRLELNFLRSAQRDERVQGEELAAVNGAITALRWVLSSHKAEKGLTRQIEDLAREPEETT